MYVLNANEKDIITFPSMVQKYLINKAKLPVYKIIRGNSYFRKTKRLQQELDKAPLWVRVLVGKEEVMKID